MTQEELLQALVAESKRHDQGQTTEEIAVTLGLPKMRVLSMLKVAKAKGKLRVGQRAGYRVDDKPTTYRVYWIDG